MTRGIVSLLAVAISVLSCSPRKPKHEEFLRQFIASVNDDTDFHRQYVHPEDRTDFAKYRAFMSKDYSIIYHDTNDLHWGVLYGQCQYEYGLCFAGDTRGYVDIAEHDGEPRVVALRVYTQQKCDGSLKVPRTSTPSSVDEPSAGP